MAKKKAPTRPPIKATLKTLARRDEHVVVCQRLDGIETTIRLLIDRLQGLIGLTGEVYQKLETVQTQVHDVLRVRVPEDEETTNEKTNDDDLARGDTKGSPTTSRTAATDAGDA